MLNNMRTVKRETFYVMRSKMVTKMKPTGSRKQMHLVYQFGKSHECVIPVSKNKELLVL